MSIQEHMRKFKSSSHFDDILLVLVIVFIGVGSFVLGRLSHTHQPESLLINHETRNNSSEASVSLSQNKADVAEKQYVASKNGTKYHLLWCPGAKQIKDENKIYFSAELAEKKAGYAPASNCKGL